VSCATVSRHRRRRCEFPSTDRFYISAIREQDYAVFMRNEIREKGEPKG